MFYEDTIAWAERTGYAALARRFREQGPPPYEETWPYAAMLSYEREWNDYPRNAEYDARGEMPFNVFVNEYSLMEQVHAFNAFLDTSKQLIVFELSGHRPLFEEPDRFHRVMTDIVLRESE
jgi:pimeloyl-ACP methyl ester carboxylesterase